MGCQCVSCLQYSLDNSLECNIEYIKQYEDWKYFIKTVPNSTSGYWNNRYTVVGMGSLDDNSGTLISVYSPLHGTEYESYEQWALRTGYPITFIL